MNFAKSTADTFITFPNPTPFGYPHPLLFKPHKHIQHTYFLRIPAFHTQLDISADLPRFGLDAALHKLCQPCRWEFTAQIGWFPSCFKIHRRSIQYINWRSPCFQ